MINVKLLVLFVCIDIHESCAKYCEICPSHTLCMYKYPGPSPTCTSYDKAASLTQDDVQSIVNKINQRRNFVAQGLARNLPSAANMNRLETYTRAPELYPPIRSYHFKKFKMVWSEELAVFAQRWVDQCDAAIRPDHKDRCRDLADMKVGQNIATITGLSPGLNVKSFVETWFMEALHYTGSVTYYNQSQESKTNYFTQLIWAETSLVGCGKARFSIDARGTMVERLVCNFAPRGNVLGKPVYTIGYPATQCKENAEKDQLFTGLCRTIPGTTTETTTSHTVSSLLRILSVPNSSLKQDIDPIRNEYRNQDTNVNAVNPIRHQKMRHIPNNTHAIQHELLPMIPLHIQTAARIPPRHDAIQHQHTMSHIQNMHDGIYETRPPVENYRRHDNGQPNNAYIGQDFRRFSSSGSCTRSESNAGGGHDKNDCLPKNDYVPKHDYLPKNDCPKEEIAEHCTRGRQGHQYILTTQTPCQKPVPQFTMAHSFPHELCACNSQMTTCLPSTTQCTCNMNCRCFNVNNYASGNRRHIPGEYYYDFQDFGMRGGEEIEMRHLLKPNEDRVQTTSLATLNTNNEDYSENEYFTNKYKQIGFNKQKLSYRKKGQSRKFPFDPINHSQRQKREREKQIERQPFWIENDYDKQLQLKSLRYTTLSNKRRQQIRTNSYTEPITINVDITEQQYDITEKFLSFDELMRLRKNNGGEVRWQNRRKNSKTNKTTTAKVVKTTTKKNDKSTTTTKITKQTVKSTTKPTTTSTKKLVTKEPDPPIVTTPLFKPLKHCSRRVTCTWTAPTVTGEDGRVIQTQKGGGQGGSRTPPGYVDGCTRTSTCTREFMNRNKQPPSTSADNFDGSGEQTVEDEDYCERRALNVERRDSYEGGTVQTLLFDHYETNTEIPTQETNSIKYEPKGTEGDCEQRSLNVKRRDSYEGGTVQTSLFDHYKTNTEMPTQETNSINYEPTGTEGDCERRLLNVERRDSYEGVTVQTSLFDHCETNTEIPTQETNSIKYETTGNGDDCSCDDQDTRAKRSICVHEPKASLKFTKNCKRRYLDDMYLLILRKFIMLWDKNKQNNNHDGCVCNASNRTQRQNLDLNYLLIFLSISCVYY